MTVSTGGPPRGASSNDPRVRATTTAPAEPRRIVDLDIEQVRLPAERELLDALEKDPFFARIRGGFEPPEPAIVRRTLMGQSLRLTEGMAPEAYATARAALATLGIARPIEIYQSSGRENAAIHLIEEPIVVEVQGRLLGLLDAGAALALFGHELGHYLAHGPSGPLGRGGALATSLAAAEGVPAGLARTASTLSMVKELTADRVGLLACQDLEAVLRLEMISTTGLPGGSLTWDTGAYLAQCRELMEQCLAEGQAVMGTTHPEHNLRAWAAWLFHESDLYRTLTGKGSGARPLAEVNALLARILQRPDIDPTYHMFDEQPRELHECALSASVLVAFADGEMATVEVEAIERVFAPIIPDFRWYLNRENALQRFTEVGGLVAGGGQDIQRALFQLLMHVVGADGTCDEREIEMVAAIGDALGCGTAYRAMLVPMLAHLGVAVPDLSKVTVSVPLPPRRGEAEAALDLFLQGFLRRGGGETNLRRLLRLLGEPQRSAARVADIARAVERAGLLCERALDGAELDERLVLLPREGARPAAPREPKARSAHDGSPVRGRLQRALVKLREQLISGDGRSPAVRLHRPRSGRSFDLAALEAVSVGLSERALAQIRDGKATRLLDAAEIGKHDGARRVAAELVDLDRENQARMDETGASDLFVGYPFLTGVVDGYLFRGPLVLHPVVIERDGRGARSFSLRPRKDEEPVANQALVRLLFAKKKFALSDELAAELDTLAADPARGAEAVLALIVEIGFDAAKLTGHLVPLRERAEEFAAWSSSTRNSRFEVEECAVLGLFPQSASDLLQDYDGLFADLGQEGADPGQLLGCAIEMLPAEVRSSFVALDVTPAPPVAAERLMPVLHADPSQREVIARARQARALVVDGPPGTGKSQVIVNLVADAVGRGQRVAVVSEKRAALDVVVQRLDGVGLRHVLALVHDVYEDRRPVYQQIVARLESSAERTWDEAELASLGAEIASLSAALDERARSLGHRPKGHALTVGQLHALVAGIAAPLLSGGEGLSRVDEATLLRLLPELIALRPFADLFAASSALCDPTGQRRRASLRGLSEAEIQAIGRRIDEAVSSAQAFEQASAVSPAALEAVAPARPALEAARETRPERQSLEDRQIFLRLLDSASVAPERVSLAVEADRAWSEHRAALAQIGERVAFEAPPALEHALALVLAWAGRFFRFFVLAWWSARKTVRSALIAAWPERSAAPLDAVLIAEIKGRLQAARAWKQVDAAFDALGLRSRLPAALPAAAALVAKVGELARRALPLGAARAQLVAAGAWPDPTVSDGTEAWDRAIDARLSLLAARDRHREAAAELAMTFPWLGELPPHDRLSTLESAWRRDAGRAVEADRRLAAAQSIHAVAEALLDRLVAELGEADASSWRLATIKAWGAAWISQIERSGAPPVSTVGGHADEHGAALALSEQVKRGSQLERARIVHRLDDLTLLRTAQPLKGRRRTADQAAREQLLKECRKQRNIMPLRTLVRKFAGQGLLELMPVWLVSPETMAVLFPREALFDLVIFDEASQCTVENGLPVLLRARRVVIAGDEKQMPPTSFFSSQISLDDTPEQDRAEGTGDLLDEESLLTLARNRVEHAGLNWHYRCREEELIAFSNHAMYGGDLLTIPSTSTRTALPALRWIDVPDGQYDAGRNVVEAGRVVEEIHALLQRDPRPSLGVVTFNLQQRRAVLDEVDRRRASDADFAARWDSAMSAERLDERPFVKNLENVQGDERDVIVFSLGHAPVEREVKGRGHQRHVPSRFGPLGQRGGERRLNVAVSRAKTECVVVSSFDPAMLSVASTAHDGPKLFKSFLEFAKHLSESRRAQAERVLALVREGAAPVGARNLGTFPGYIPLKAQIAAALEQRGVKYELDVGTSRFRVPLAVVSAEDPKRYTVAVLCDEGDEEVPVFERHVQRPQALEERGWRVLRVSARDWMRSPEQEMRRILGR